MKNTTFAFTLIIGLVVGISLGYVIWKPEPKEIKNIEEVKYSPSPMVKDEPVHSMDGVMTDMSSGLKGKTGDALDKAFLSEMITHHEGAVDMAQIVLDNSKRLELRKFAENIILVQKGEVRKMMDWQDSWFK